MKNHFGVICICVGLAACAGTGENQDGAAAGMNMGEAGMAAFQKPIRLHPVCTGSSYLASYDEQRDGTKIFRPGSAVALLLWRR